MEVPEREVNMRYMRRCSQNDAKKAPVAFSMSIRLDREMVCVEVL